MPNFLVNPEARSVAKPGVASQHAEWPETDTHTHKTQTSKGDNSQLATDNRRATTKQPWGNNNNKNNDSNDEHFVNPVFMRNYVFFALVSQAVSETRRAESNRVSSTQNKCEATLVGIRPVNPPTSMHPLPWQFILFALRLCLWLCLAPSPAMKLALAAFSLAQSPLLPLLFIFRSERRFFFAFAIHCQLPCASISLHAILTIFISYTVCGCVSVSVYLYLCLRLCFQSRLPSFRAAVACLVLSHLLFTAA